MMLNMSASQLPPWKRILSQIDSLTTPSVQSEHGNSFLPSAMGMTCIITTGRWSSKLSSHKTQRRTWAAIGTRVFTVQLRGYLIPENTMYSTNEVSPHARERRQGIREEREQAETRRLGSMQKCTDTRRQPKNQNVVRALGRTPMSTSFGEMKSSQRVDP